MTNELSGLLKPCGAYKDLAQPTILAAGELGLYFVNMENLLEDNGAWEQFGDDSKGMITHAVQRYAQVPGYRSMIDAMASRAQSLFQRSLPDETNAISGGARRDWLFSGPIASVLGVPHISCYKQEPGRPDRMEVVYNSGKATRQVSPIGDLSRWYVVHAVDMTTEGSSILNTDKEGTLKGWAPMIRNKGGRINDVVAAATRLQGAEQRLMPYGINIDAMVRIDTEFLQQHSSNPAVAVEYIKNPMAFSKSYLAENGALAFVGNFDPRGKRVDKARAFMQRYGNFLAESGKLVELSALVQEKYGTTIQEITGVTI